MTRVRVLNIAIDHVNWPEALTRAKHARFVVTPNIDHLYTLRRNSHLRAAYQHADLVLCDSRILSWLSRPCCGTFLPQVAGSDFFPAFCRHYAADPDVRIFLLGGTTPDHAARAAIRLHERHGARIAGHYSPPFGFEHDPAQLADIRQQLTASGATIVAVGLGSPKQELLIQHLLASAIPTVRTYLAVGATIDFESGLVSRAPQLVSRLGLEWLYRFAREPRRLFRRYFLHDPLVLYWLVAQRLRSPRAQSAP